MFSWAPIAGDAAESVDARRLRQALGAFPTGVCLATTVSAGGKREGMTINSFASVSLEPPLVLWSVRDAARSADAFLAVRAFNLAVLAAPQRELALHFARPAADKFEAHADAFEVAPNGCPRLKHAAATFDCSVYSRHSEGDHTILLGRVERFACSEAAPLLLHGGQMGSLWDLAGALSAPAPPRAHASP